MKSLGSSIVKLHLTGTDQKIKQMFRWLVIGFIAGLWMSLEEGQCKGGYARSFCYNTSSLKTCFTTFLFINNNFRVPTPGPVEEVSGWFTSTAAGSSLIIINILESQGTVEIFIAGLRHVLANKTIVLEAQKLSANVSFERLWVNGHQPEQRDAKHFRDGACVESLNGQSLPYCVGYVESQDHYICEHSGHVTTVTISGDAKPDDSSYEQCICTSPQSNRGNNDYDGKWWSCNCNLNCAIVCHKGTTGDSASTSSMTQKPTNRASDNQTTAFTSLSLSSSSAAAAASLSTGFFSSFGTIQILLLLLLVAFAFIVVAIVLVIRKRKYAGRHEVSPMKKTDQNEAVPPVYETMVPDNRPSGGIVPIYTELELTQQPTPSNSTTYASIQPTSEVVVIGKSVEYVDIDFPLKDQQKPKSADKGTVSVSPIYSQPFESPTSDTNTDYVDPYKPDVKPTATAPVQSHQAAADQKNVYSLAKEIPSGDPNAIYSEPNKPTKSSTAIGKADPIHLEVIDVK